MAEEVVKKDDDLFLRIWFTEKSEVCRRGETITTTEPGV